MKKIKGLSDDAFLASKDLCFNIKTFLKGLEEKVYQDEKYKDNYALKSLIDKALELTDRMLFGHIWFIYTNEYIYHDFGELEDIAEYLDMMLENISSWMPQKNKIIYKARGDLTELLDIVYKACDADAERSDDYEEE